MSRHRGAIREGAAGTGTRWGRTRGICLARCLGAGVLLLLSAAGSPERQQYETVFEGRPGKRVVTGYTEAGWTVQEEMLGRDESEEYLVRVVRDRGGNYFWASREMLPMERMETEGFVTWSAGAYGYVKTYREPVLEMVREAGVFEPGHEYMEHVINVLYSVNYWGTRTDH